MSGWLSISLLKSQKRLLLFLIQKNSAFPEESKTQQCQKDPSSSTLMRQDGRLELRGLISCDSPSLDMGAESAFTANFDPRKRETGCSHLHPCLQWFTGLGHQLFAASTDRYIPPNHTQGLGRELAIRKLKLFPILT